jgi:serine/threonine protein kinase
MHRDIKPENLL